MILDKEEGSIKMNWTARLKKATQLTAMTLGLVVSVQSFAQEDCEDSGGSDDDCVIDLGSSGGAYDPGYPDPPDFGWWDGGGSGGSGGSSSGGGSGGGGGSTGNPATCPSSTRSMLRNQRLNTPGCYGDPGPNFDAQAWFDGEQSALFGTGNLFYDEMFPAFEWLAGQYVNNNGDMYTPYSGFHNMLWNSCNSVPVVSNRPGSILPGTYNSRNDCRYNVWRIMDGYFIALSVPQYILNWLLGTNFDTNAYNTTWGGRLNQAVTNHQACHEIYQAWNELQCGGTP